jgi:hypothetical protein
LGKDKWVKWGVVKKTFKQWDFGEADQSIAGRAEKIRQFRESWTWHGQALCDHFSEYGRFMDYSEWKPRNRHLVAVLDSDYPGLRRNPSGFYRWETANMVRGTFDRLRASQGQHLTLIFCNGETAHVLFQEQLVEHLPSIANDIEHCVGHWQTRERSAVFPRPVQFLAFLKDVGKNYVHTMIEMLMPAAFPPPDMSRIAATLRTGEIQRNDAIWFTWWGDAMTHPVYREYVARGGTRKIKWREDESYSKSTEYLQVGAI